MSVIRFVDTESDGLLQHATKVWCISAIDLGCTEDEVVHFPPDKVEDGLKYLHSADVLVFHNAIDHDLPLLKKLYGWKPRKNQRVIDTLVYSRLLYPKRPRPAGYPNVSPHSIEAWGIRLGVSKPAHEDWTKYSEEMRERCNKDVIINQLLYKELEKEAHSGKLLLNTKLTVDHALRLELKVAEICREMAVNGFPLDVEECNKQINLLQERIDWVDSAILPFIPPKPKMKGSPVVEVFKLNGDYRKSVTDWYPELEQNDLNFEVVGQFCKVEWEPINLDSPKQVNEWLLKNGWKPTEWNYKKDKRGKELKDEFGKKIKTSPRITEDSFESLEKLGISGKLIAYRRKCTHKRNTLKGFLREMREDGTVPSFVNTLGAATRRMTHRVIANVPSPNKKGAFWKHIRKVFYGGGGDYVVVGADASQIQIRGLGHYAKVLCNDDQLIKDIVAADKGEGKDVHTLNGERAGVSRDESKGIFYGYLFGATVYKTAKQLNKTVKETEKIREKFDKAVPFVSNIIDKLVAFYRVHGYITGIDGTKIYAENEKDLLVYLLQNFEVVFMKTALCFAYDRIKKEKLRAKLATMQHDEFQFVSHKDDAKRVAEILEESMSDAGNVIGSVCPIIGEAKIGKSWYETH